MADLRPEEGAFSYAAVILAAGRSIRFGAEDKLLVNLAGKPLLSHVCETVKAMALSQVCVVCPSGGEIASLVQAFGFQAVPNDKPDCGMGHSIALGAEALRPCDGVFVFLGDMPHIPARVCKSLIGSHQGRHSRIACPSYGGRYGHPVLFGWDHVAELQELSGDRGAKHLLAKAESGLSVLDVDTAAIHYDIDRPDDL